MRCEQQFVTLMFFPVCRSSSSRFDGGGGRPLCGRGLPFENHFPYNRSGLTTFRRVHGQKPVLFPDWKWVNNREWAHCCGRGWIVAAWMMCSSARRRKGKHMCACSFVNKLHCRIPPWPDVMDKCQTSALTPLLERAWRNTVRSVTAGKTEPQLHVMNASQGTHKDPREDTYTHTLTDIQYPSVKS